MIEFFSSWAKGIGVTVVIISIFEMILPNNTSKKYIRIVLGIYLLFNIISPIISNKDVLNVKDIDLEEISTTSTEVNQTSMNSRIKKLYDKELEKDITKKLKEKGYEVITCNVMSQISTKEDEDTKINKIKLKVNKTDNKEENQKEDTESKIVSEIQKIKKVETHVKIGDDSDDKNEKNDKQKTDENNKITRYRNSKH